MSDETVPSGEKVLTSGGDQIFPKGLPVGTVTKISPGSELFLNIRVKPAADLSRLEEVLVITQREEKEPVASETEPMRAADILAERLPTVPPKPAPDAGKQPAAAVATPGAKPATPTSTQVQVAKPADGNAVKVVKPAAPKQGASGIPPKPAAVQQKSADNAANSAASGTVSTAPADQPPSAPATQPPAPQDTPH